MMLYCFFFKAIFLLEIMTVAWGFILRALSGAFLIQESFIDGSVEQISPWLTICTGLGALFVLLIKRHSELVSTNDVSSKRKVLGSYSEHKLSLTIVICEILTLISYIFYCLSGSIIPFFNGNVPKDLSFLLTVPFVLLGMRRYKNLAFNKPDGEHPESVLIKDSILQLISICWIIACVLMISLRI